jgi:hypothetical protein
MARDLDELVRDFREHPLDAGPYTFVAADALTMKVREGGRVIKIAVMVATGVNADGYREILGEPAPKARAHPHRELMRRERGLLVADRSGLAVVIIPAGLVPARHAHFGLGCCLDSCLC